jgi:hypothetical protein
MTDNNRAEIWKVRETLELMRKLAPMMTDAEITSIAHILLSAIIRMEKEAQTL